MSGAGWEETGHCILQVTVNPLLPNTHVKQLSASEGYGHSCCLLGTLHRTVTLVQWVKVGEHAGEETAGD